MHQNAPSGGNRTYAALLSSVGPCAFVGPVPTGQLRFKSGPHCSQPTSQHVISRNCSQPDWQVRSTQRGGNDWGQSFYIEFAHRTNVEQLSSIAHAILSLPVPPQKTVVSIDANSTAAGREQELGGARLAGYSCPNREILNLLKGISPADCSCSCQPRQRKHDVSRSRRRGAKLFTHRSKS